MSITFKKVLSSLFPAQAHSSHACPSRDTLPGSNPHPRVKTAGVCVGRAAPVIATLKRPERRVPPDLVCKLIRPKKCLGPFQIRTIGDTAFCPFHQGLLGSPGFSPPSLQFGKLEVAEPLRAGSSRIIQTRSRGPPTPHPAPPGNFELFWDRAWDS